jgi:hypothetical protein
MKFEKERRIHHDICKRRTTLADGRDNGLHHGAIAKVNVKVCRGGKSDAGHFESRISWCNAGMWGAGR